MLSHALAILCLVMLFCAQATSAQTYDSPPVQEQRLLAVLRGAPDAHVGRLVRTDGANPSPPTRRA